MGCKQQMVTLYQRRALGSSAQPSLLFFELILNLGIVCSESRLEPASFLPELHNLKVCTGSHFPSPSLLFHSWKSLSDADNPPIPSCNYT